jgi:hypothetical protein
MEYYKAIKNEQTSYTQKQEGILQVSKPTITLLKGTKLGGKK